MDKEKRRRKSAKRIGEGKNILEYIKGEKLYKISPSRGRKKKRKLCKRQPPIRREERETALGGEKEKASS